MKRFFWTALVIAFLFIFSGCDTSLDETTVDEVYTPIIEAIDEVSTIERYGLRGDIYLDEEVKGNLNIKFGKEKIIYDFEFEKSDKISIYFSGDYGIVYLENNPDEQFEIIEQEELPFLINLKQIVPDKELLSNAKKSKNQYAYSVNWNDLDPVILLFFKPSSEKIDFLVEVNNEKITKIEYSFNVADYLVKISLRVEELETEPEIPTEILDKVEIYNQHKDLLNLVNNSSKTDYFQNEIIVEGKNANYLINSKVDNKNKEAVVEIDDQSPSYYQDGRVYFRDGDVGGFLATEWIEHKDLYSPYFVPINAFVLDNYLKTDKGYSFEMSSKEINRFSDSYFFSVLKEEVSFVSASVNIETNNDYITSLEITFLDSNNEETVLKMNIEALKSLDISKPDFSEYIDIDAEIAKFEYVLKEDQTIKITYVEKDTQSLFIPSKINGYIVNEISQDSFNFEAITTVVLPKTLEIIRANAFSGSSIETLSIPKNVYIIEELGTLPYLKEIKVDENNQNYQVVNQALVNSENELMFFPLLALVEELIIPKEIVKIGKRAFSYSEYLKSIRFEAGSKLETIDDFAFSSSNIESIELPLGLKYINESAFINCGKLTSLEIPNSVLEIGHQAFYYMYELKELKLPFVGSKDFNTLEQQLLGVNSINYILNNEKLEVLTITDMALISTGSLGVKVKKLNIENALQIGSYAFLGAEIEELSISDKIERFHVSVFGGEVKIKKLMLPFVGGYLGETLPEDEFSAVHTFRYFYGGDMSENNIIEEVTIYGDYDIYDKAFYRTNIKKINLTGNIKDLGESTFEGSPLTETINIASTLITEIKDYTFANMPSLKTVNLNSEISFIGKDIFLNSDNFEFEKQGVLYYFKDWLMGYEKTSQAIDPEKEDGVPLDSLEFKADTTGIYYHALENFSHHYQLARAIEIPDTVKYIYDSAFSNTNNIINLETATSLIYIGENAIGNYNQTTGYLPGSLTYLGDYNFYNYPELIINTMPKFEFGYRTITASHILVNEDIYDEFIEKYPSLASKVYINEGYKFETTIKNYYGEDINLIYRLIDVEGGVKIIYLLEHLSSSRLKYTVPTELNNKSVVEIGSRAISGDFEEFRIENSVKKIAKEAFIGVDAFVIYVGYSVDYIGEAVFNLEPTRRLTLPFLGSKLNPDTSEEKRLSWLVYRGDSDMALSLYISGGTIFREAFDNQQRQIFLYLDDSVVVEDGALNFENVHLMQLP
ncbi:MAG: leucine-rich repeat domain-containing protein [Bacilli bacterium]|nr:leucine-rich repeat domain-containing protein [Bacilli bacterium]